MRFAGLWRFMPVLVMVMASCPACAEPKHEMTLAEFRDSTDMEPRDLMYRQSYAVKRALDAMQPQHPGKTDLYYIGFATDGAENDFDHDVELAQKRLKAYGAAGHGMLLLNDVDHAYDTPIADVDNLRAAIEGVARRMDTREDVLLLFLSGHGGSNASLWVHYPPMRLHNLHAQALKRMLDESGIRNRIIVISACYSGAFIDALKDDNTLVLTSASRDHESYSYGVVAENTEFANAYFGASLQDGASFVDAFAAARRLIAAREERGKVKPSNPQIYVGRNIGRVLKRLPFTGKRLPLRRLASAPQPQVCTRDYAASFMCPMSGGSAVCRSGEIHNLISAAWADYLMKTHPVDIYIPYYRFIIRKGVPVRGRVTIEVWLDDQSLMRARKVMVVGGGARYIYDLKKRKIVARKYFK